MAGSGGDAAAGARGYPGWPWRDDTAVDGRCRYEGWVPVRAGNLVSVSRGVGAVLRARWWNHEEEHEWEKKAAAAGPGAAAEQQLALARELYDVLSLSESVFSSMLHIVEGDVDEAVDPGRRPRPESATWWHRRRGCGAGGHGARFVHLSADQVAHVRELIADALALTQRLLAPAADLERHCAGPVAAAIHSTPLLLRRLRRAQRLADAVLIPLHEFKHLIDCQIEPRAPRRGGGRGRSAPPPMVRQPVITSIF